MKATYKPLLIKQVRNTYLEAVQGIVVDHEKCDLCGGTGEHHDRDAQGHFHVPCQNGCLRPRLFDKDFAQCGLCLDCGCHRDLDTRGICADCEGKRKKKAESATRPKVA